MGFLGLERIPGFLSKRLFCKALEPDALGQKLAGQVKAGEIAQEDALERIRQLSNAESVSRAIAAFYWGN